MTFRDLHFADTPLLLPNAWDVGSALAFVDAGFPAVATTSFGVGATDGHPDGAGSSREGTQRLVRALRRLPAFVSADIEDGYSDDPAEVADFVAGLDVAGVNLEDSSHGVVLDPAVLAAKISRVKQASPAVFVNARIDNYWFGQDADVTSVLDRARRYIEAGADGIFVPGLTDADAIRAITAQVDVPLNLLPIAGLTLRDLADLGVRRVSTGSLPYRAALDAGVAAATGLRDGGSPMPATPYPDAQAMLERYHHLL